MPRLPLTAITLYQYHVGVVRKGHQQESENGH